MGALIVGGAFKLNWKRFGCDAGGCPGKKVNPGFWRVPCVELAAPKARIL